MTNPLRESAILGGIRLHPLLTDTNALSGPQIIYNHHSTESIPRLGGEGGILNVYAWVSVGKCKAKETRELPQFANKPAKSAAA